MSFLTFLKSHVIALFLLIHKRDTKGKTKKRKSVITVVFMRLSLFPYFLNKVFVLMHSLKKTPQKAAKFKRTLFG